MIVFFFIVSVLIIGVILAALRMGWQIVRFLYDAIQEERKPEAREAFRRWGEKYPTIRQRAEAVRRGERPEDLLESKGNNGGTSNDNDNRDIGWV